MNVHKIPYTSFILLLAACSCGVAMASGYLDQTTRIDLAAILPPPPAAESPALRVDEQVFQSTRLLAGNERWKLATKDDVLDVSNPTAPFSCALGFSLTRKNAPHVYHLLTRAAADLSTMVEAGKRHFARRRPFIGNALPICADRRDYEQSPSYPSGHTTAGWSLALILAELVPDRANALMVRGRTFGESRVVCGVHWVSDVEAGKTAAGAVVAALHGNAEFRADMELARAEIAALRKSAPPPEAQSCKIEDAAATTHPW